MADLQRTDKTTTESIGRLPGGQTDEPLPWLMRNLKDKQQRGDQQRPDQHVPDQQPCELPEQP